MFLKIWSCLFLFICGVIDLKTRRVYPGICAVNYGMAIIIKLLLKDIDFCSLVAGIVLCGILLMISLVTKEAIGQGDILILLTLTGILSIKNMLEILFMALVLCSLFSMAMLIFKKMKLKNAIPFVPFLFVGNIFWIVLGELYV